MKKTVHLIDLFPNAERTALEKNYTGIQPIAIDRDKRMCLFNHPPSSITFDNVVLGASASLSFGCGIKEVAWPKMVAKVLFTITVKDQNGRVHRLFRLKQYPQGNKSDQKFSDHTLSLKQFENQTVSITFHTRTAWNKPSHYCWSGWSDPVLEYHDEKEVILKKKTKHPLILLITSDALRKDFLECYNHPICKTEHLKNLAKEGSLFTHARSQCSTTLGSYASLLTGLHVKEHQIAAEWGTLPSHLETLPKYLERQGFHTLFVPSEEDNYNNDTGVTTLFKEVIPCLAKPAQDGAITTRKAINWLSNHFDQPTLMWVQYFDTHPPHAPKKPFNSLYYKNDPTNPKNEYKTEWVERIRGMESVAEIDYTLNVLKKGLVPHAFYERLMSTAHYFLGLTKAAPDLASHLIALGKESTLQMDQKEFAHWLIKEAPLLLEKKPSQQLLAWLLDTRKRLIEIEKEILSWLKGVKDYRFPISQYMSMCSYFDSHIGKLIKHLKDEGLYDDTMIIVTSPHGEILSEHDIHYHHHAITEEVLRVPLIIKPFGKKDGQKINGIFDSIDLFPTILESLNMISPHHLQGKSRFKNMQECTDILPHDSFSIDYNSSIVSITHEPFIFIKALKDAYLSDEWCWKQGEKGLYLLQETMNYKDNQMHRHPQIAEELESRLHAFLQAT